MTLALRFVALLALVHLTACGAAPEAATQRASQTQDLTPPGSFTDGVEGPATDAYGNLYAVNYQRQGTIGRITPGGKAEVFVELPEGSTGNGIRVGADGKLYVADYTGHNILRIDPETRAVQVYARTDRAHQPNDLTIAPDGTIYASDPNWTEATGQLWRVKNNGQDAEGRSTKPPARFDLMEIDMGTTNGIEVSRDGKYLFVNESAQRKIYRYELDMHGRPTKKTEWAGFNDYGLDGMRIHPDGNLYVARYGKGVIAVLNPEGEVIREIRTTGKKPTNVAFSPDYSRCYVTMQDRGCVEYFDVLPGRSEPSAVSLRHGGQPVVTYRIRDTLPSGVDGIYRRSGFLYDITTPAGVVVTDAFPVSHTHHHGLFSAWTQAYVRDSFVDFWNEQKGLGKVIHAELGEGRPNVLRARLRQVSSAHGPAIREFWNVALKEGTPAAHRFEWSIRQTNVSGDTIHFPKYHYGGLGVRGHAQWNEADSTHFVRRANFLTSEGVENFTANHTRPTWTAIYGPIDGRMAGIAVIDHPQNFRHPQPVRVHDKMPYFSVSPPVVGAFDVAPGAEYVATYTVVAFDGEVPVGYLDSLAAGLIARPSEAGDGR